MALGLFAFGAGSGSWDVAMNVQGAAVERLPGRAIMSRFHAGFSVGTVAAALLGAVMVALGVSVTAHLLAVGVAVAIGVPLAARDFIDDQHDSDEPGAGARASLGAWRERRTLLIGLFVLAFAFGEGAGNDWISVAMIDGHDVAPAVGTLAFAGLPRRHDHRPLVRTGAARPLRPRAASTTRSALWPSSGWRCSPTARARRWRSPAPSCGAPGSRSGSPWA